MGVLQSILVALDMLRLHKLRAFLTMVGVIIGVMSVTIIVMISNGFKSYIDTMFKRLGSDTIIVAYDPGRQDRGQRPGSIAGLTLDDKEYLQDRVAALDVVSATQEIGAKKLRVGDREVDNPRISAIDENFTTLNRIDVVEGRHITLADVRTRANVCVIGEELRDRLFPEGGSIGKQITLPGITLEVVGVLEKLDLMGDGTERMLMLPLSTAQDKWVGGEFLNFITMRPKAGQPVNATVQAVWEAMMLKSNNRAVYRVDSREAILNIFGQILGVTGIILAAIAALSLLVGGIGIMNIMLVSVNERTREIGLRKAVGAPRRTILMQFLVEAGTLSLVGGLIGMGIAYMLGVVVNLVTISMKWPSAEGLSTPFPMSAAIASAAFSALIGMVFGFYPAMSAAKMDPIVALRHE